MEQRGIRNIIVKVNHQKNLNRLEIHFDRVIKNFEDVGELLMNNKSGVL